MNYLKIKPFYLLLLSAFFIGCEKDDICSEETQTTSQLVIELFDATSTEDLKIATGLLVYGINDDNIAIPLLGQTISDKSKVTVPLRTDSNITRLVLHKDYSIDNNGTPDDPSDDFALGNSEIINLNYTPEDIYVSRACGYKKVFTNLNGNFELDGDNWIASLVIEENTTVENETSTHVKIYH